MTKRCSKCGQEKDVSEFYRHRGRGDGYSNRCAVCDKEAHKKRYWQNRTAFKGYQRTQRLKRYGLTRTEHMWIYIKQKGCCSLCGRPVAYDKIHTDHNHDTGKFRSLLCHRCNLMVGYIDKTPPGLLRQAQEYVKAHK